MCIRYESLKDRYQGDPRLWIPKIFPKNLLYIQEFQDLESLFNSINTMVVPSPLRNSEKHACHWLSGVNQAEKPCQKLRGPQFRQWATSRVTKRRTVVEQRSLRKRQEVEIRKAGYEIGPQSRGDSASIIYTLFYTLEIVFSAHDRSPHGSHSTRPSP